MSLSSFEDLFLPKIEAKMFQITKEHENKYVTIDDENILHLVKRSDFPTIHVKGTKKRTCQNMNGILGGSNAFNFLSFVAGVITLVVNVNNNVNNNNNNLNGINANVNAQQNNNANANTNAANVILVMPGKKKRSLEDDENVDQNVRCSSNFLLAIYKAMQDYNEAV